MVLFISRHLSRELRRAGLNVLRARVAAGTVGPYCALNHTGDWPMCRTQCRDYQDVRPGGSNHCGSSVARTKPFNFEHHSASLLASDIHRSLTLTRERNDRVDEYQFYDEPCANQKSGFTPINRKNCPFQVIRTTLFNDHTIASEQHYQVPLSALPLTTARNRIDGVCHSGELIPLKQSSCLPVSFDVSQLLPHSSDLTGFHLRLDKRGKGGHTLASNPSRPTNNLHPAGQDGGGGDDQSNNPFYPNNFTKKLQDIQERENIMTIPNLLCMSRIAVTPILAYLMFQSEFKVALGIFVCAGATDLIDGWIARTFRGQASNFGSFLDPLADKILVAGTFIALTCVDRIPLLLTAMCLFRDAVLVGSGFYVRYKSLPAPRTFSRFFDATLVTAQLQPLFISKVNTLLQLALVSLTLFDAAIDTIQLHTVLEILWYTTGATTTASAFGYVFSSNTYSVLSELKKNSAAQSAADAALKKKDSDTKR